jgi:hypothetical protein
LSFETSRETRRPKRKNGATQIISHKIFLVPSSKRRKKKEKKTPSIFQYYFNMMSAQQQQSMDSTTTMTTTLDHAIQLNNEGVRHRQTLAGCEEQAVALFSKALCLCVFKSLISQDTSKDTSPSRSILHNSTENLPQFEQKNFFLFNSVITTCPENRWESQVVSDSPPESPRRRSSEFRHPKGAIDLLPIPPRRAITRDTLPMIPLRHWESDESD